MTDLSQRYPAAIDEAIGFLEAADHAQTGDTLLVLRDINGVQVSLRLRGTAVSTLAEKLAAGPRKAETPPAG